MEFSLLKIGLTISAGFASVASPCVLPILPVVIAGTGKEDRLRPFLLVLGLSITFILMGVISSAFGSFIGSGMRYIEIAAAIIILFFGVFMLFDINIFKKMYWFSNIHVSSTGKWSGLLVGLSLGIIWIPCIGPILSSILAMVASEGKIFYGIFFLSIYSVGFALPILALGYFSHIFRTRLRTLQKHEFVIRMLSSAILIVFGLYIILIGSLPQF